MAHRLPRFQASRLCRLHRSTVGNDIITAVYSGDSNYASVTSEFPVTVVVNQTVTSTTLSASTNSGGTTLVANVVVTSPGDPNVSGSVSFYNGSVLVGTAPVVNGVATLNLGVLPGGTYTFRAEFSGSTASTSTDSINITTDGPRVASVLRYGYHWQPTYLIIYFNSALDPASAENVANYTIAGPGNSLDQIAIRSAIYDPTTDSVTLVPAGRLNLHWVYHLTINGTSSSGVSQ